MVGGRSSGTLAVPYHPHLRFDMPVSYKGMNLHIWAAHDRMFDWLVERGLLPTGGGNLSVLKGSRCDLLTGCYFPDTDLATLALLDEFVGWGFVIDDQVDDTAVGLDPDRVAAVVFELTEILAGRPAARLTQAGAALADWWARVRALSTQPLWRAQFVSSTTAWLNTYAMESRHWAEGYTPSLEEYLEYRRNSIGSWPYSDLAEIADHGELPEEARLLPAYQEMRMPMALHVGIANDIISYEKQHRLGRQKDIVDVLIAESGCTPQEGLEQAVTMANSWMADFQRAAQKFCAQMDQAGLAPEVKQAGRQTVASLGTHIRASAEWEVLAVERFGDDEYYLRGDDPSVCDVLARPTVQPRSPASPT